ncbi:hypothetical protein EXIGUO8H_10041 [Exiguobacterium sp. 8H]|nr:hypothetical protein EXIGUO8H_10041 [Exiguobacterium sp. 8H]VXB88921.1 hypothetical protein EXIGUO8A_110214 [Exiguobacterium sp. 8A]
MTERIYNRSRIFYSNNAILMSYEFLRIICEMEGTFNALFSDIDLGDCALKYSGIYHFCR